MSSDQSYDPDHLEVLIDSCRLSGDWDGAMKSIKRYAHIFDVGIASSTRQHPEIKRVLSYYWTCMAESLLENNFDYINAIDCIKRSLNNDAEYIDAKICLSRILLDVCRSLFQNVHLSSGSWTAALNQDAQKCFINSQDMKVESILNPVFEVSLPHVLLFVDSF